MCIVASVDCSSNSFEKHYGLFAYTNKENIQTPNIGFIPGKKCLPHKLRRNFPPTTVSIPK